MAAAAVVDDGGAASAADGAVDTGATVQDLVGLVPPVAVGVAAKPAGWCLAAETFAETEIGALAAAVAAPTY